MARRAGLSQTLVWRVWRAFGLRPHGSETVKLSTDPACVDKVRDVVGLYLAPPPPHRALVLGVDENAATHKTRLIHDCLLKRPRWHLHSTPTSASWLDMVEGWFALLARRRLRRGVFETTADREAAIHADIDHTDAGPRPFVWTKSADAILASVKRFCQRTSHSDQSALVATYGREQRVRRTPAAAQSRGHAAMSSTHRRVV